MLHTCIISIVVCITYYFVTKRFDVLTESFADCIQCMAVFVLVV